MILHGSRSGHGSNTIHGELTGTVSYVARGTDGVTGWNATGGEGEVCEHMPAWRWGWHARAASGLYLGYEFAHAVTWWDVTESQVETFNWWLRELVLPIWPDLPLFFPTHAEVEVWGQTGRRDGKTDVYPYGDARADELRARILARL